MLLEFLLAFAVVALSLAGLASGLLLRRRALRGSCAMTLLPGDGACPVCGREDDAGANRP